MAMLDRYEANKVREAAGEIRHLRHRLEVAEARLSGLDGALALLHAVPDRGGGMAMGEDVAWALDRIAEGEPEVPPTGGPVEEREPGPAQHLHNRVEEGPAASPQKSDFIEKGVRPPFRPDDAL